MKGFICFTLILLTITGCGGGKSEPSSETVEIDDLTVTNNAPRILTEPSIQILEGERTVASLQAEDKESDPLKFTLESGPDKEHFTLDNQGHLVFKDLPDYEAPMDVNGDNLYEVKVAVSDGNLSDNLDLKIQVANALEGRVVDGPLAEAQVFIDCNGDGVKNENEPSTTTDEAGYYTAAMPKSCDNFTVISKGGRDTTTGKDTTMVLMARLPDNYDMSKNVVVTPVSTVLAHSNQEDQKTVLTSIGINSIESSVQLLSLDPWQEITTSKVDSKATKSITGADMVEIQKINAQLATIIETVDTLNGDDQNTNVALAIADLISQEGKRIYLNNTITLDNILDSATNNDIPNVVLEAVATINTYLAVQADPTSDTVIEIISNSQDELQESVNKLIQKQLTEDEFQQNASSDLTTIINAPIAITSKVEVPEENQVTITLKGNNSDGTVAKVLRIDEIPNHGSLKDSSGEIIKIQNLPHTLPSNQLLYTSNSNVSNDSFIFTVVDGESISAPATVAIEITGVNDRPLAKDAVITFKQGESKSILLEGSDEDGDSLNYRIVSLPKFGKLMDGDKELKLIDISYHLSESKNLITYVNSASTASTDVFYFVSNDGQVNSKRAKVTLNIEGVNQIPIIEGQQALSTPEDNSFEITLDHLIVTDNDNVYPDDFTLEIGGGTNYSIDGTTIKPKADFVGEITIPVTVNDGTHNSELYELTVEVLAQNDAPKLYPIDPINFDEDGQKILTLQGFDIDWGDQLTFSFNNDPDGKIQVRPLTPLEVGNLSTQQSYVVDSADNYHGNIELTATVTDKKGLSASQSFTVTVNPVNDAPKIKLKNVGLANEQQRYTHQVNFEDPDDANNEIDLTWTLSNAPVGMSISRTGKIQWTPQEGVSTSGAVTLTLADGGEDGAAVAEQIITVQVIQKNDPGTVFIHGKPLIGQTLTASVSDPDNGEDDIDITYQWQRNSSDSESAFSIDSSNAKPEEYELTEADIGATITVTATYTDNQNFPNVVSATTNTTVAALPITKRTITIDNGSFDETVFEKVKLLEKGFNIENTFTLKEITIERLMAIADHKLSERTTASDEDGDGDIKEYTVYSYKNIQDMYSLLDDSSVFEIAENSDIIIRTNLEEGALELPEAQVGTGEGKIRIGTSHTLALFNDSAELEGLFNIRLSPTEVPSDICLNPESPNTIDKNPVVLVHGWMGFDKADLINVSYFNKIATELATTGAQIFTTKVDPWAVPETRGEQLIAYIKCVLEQTGEDRVDLIGHSLGSATSRYAAYWLDVHEGHIPKGGTQSEVRSVTSVAATNYGGNVYPKNTDHMELLKEKNRQLYKLDILSRDFSPTDLLFEMISPEELNDENGDLGKQYKLVENILHELTRNDGMLDAVSETLSASQGIIDRLTENGEGVVAEWLRAERSIRAWDSLGVTLSLGDLINFFKFREDDPPLRTRINTVINPFYDALKKLNSGAINLRDRLDAINSQIGFIKSSLNSINDEFEKLSNPDAHPDYYALVDSMDNLQQAVSLIVTVLPDLEVTLRDELILSLTELGSALELYEKLYYQTWYDTVPSWLSDWFIDGFFLDLRVEQVKKLKHVVLVFRDILEYDLLPLLTKSSSIDVAGLIRGLSADTEEGRQPAVNKIAQLIGNDSDTDVGTLVYLLESFPRAVSRNTDTLNSLSPRWGEMINTPLSVVSTALTNTEYEMNKIDSSMDLIQSAIRVTMGQHDATWEDLLGWEMTQLHNIRDEVLGRFLNDEDERTELKDCTLNNTQLLTYIQIQKDKGDGNPIVLPDTNDLTEDCAQVINNATNKLVDHIIPMDEKNPETDEKRSKEIPAGLFAVSGFGAQMFNLKYPDTGVTPTRYKDCVDGHDFSHVVYNNNGRSTKYYSIIGNRKRVDDNFSDRIQTNMIVTANNTNSEDTLESFVELASGLVLIDRPNSKPSDENNSDDPEISKSNPEGDLTPNQIKILFENTDIIVPTCSQELGEVVNQQDGDYTFDLNHFQSINQSGIPTFAPKLIDLFMGNPVEGYASIDTEIKACNLSETVTDRKECLLDLFPRIIIMYATGTAIHGNSSLDIFDLLKAVFARDVDLQEVKNVDVPDLYRQHLEIYSDKADMGFN